MPLRPGWLALFVFVWIIGAFLGSTFEYQDSTNGEGISYSAGTATFTNGDATVVGNATVWDNATMAGGNIKIVAEGTWYKIASVTNVTHLELASNYYGTGGGGLLYTMATSPGWVGTGTGGFAQSPVTTLEYLTNIGNAFTRLPILGNIPLPVPNAEYFKTVFKVVTWDWSFMHGYSMIYWVFFAPFVCMGVLSLILIVYSVLVGNLRFGT
jgi:hypothetical protein